MNKVQGLTVEMNCSHTHMSLNQGVRRSWWFLLLLPPSFSSSSVWRKKNLFFEIARPISAYFCFERKVKHWLKNWVTKELWVWRAKSQPFWCSTAFFFFFGFVYLVIVHSVQATLKSSVFLSASLNCWHSGVSNRNQYLRLWDSSMTKKYSMCGVLFQFYKLWERKQKCMTH